jgi:Fur family transcriptional regulator, ferric uptake regulator
MSHHVSVLEQLRAGGHRLTPQRDMIVQTVMDMDGHFSAESVFAAVQQWSSAVNIATVYRTLDLLAEMCVITATTLADGSKTYERTGCATHHHLVCERCQAAITVDDEVMHTLSEQLRQRYGFEAGLQHLIIFGTCAACRAAEEHSALHSDTA